MVLIDPKNRKHVRLLLDLLGYYRKFIPNFAELTAPLTELITKGKPNNVVWAAECDQALKRIQEMFSKEPILVLPNLSEMFVVRTDASDTGIGAVLLQERDDILMPCAYVSRKLLDREQKYPIIERECLAIVFALNKFAKYLMLNTFIIETDHKPLLFLKKGKANNNRLLRWSLALQEYNFTIRAISGDTNHHADVLSRLI